MYRKLLTLLAVLCVPIALAVASQSLAATSGPPEPVSDEVAVRLSGDSGPADPSDGTGTNSPGDPKDPRTPGTAATDGSDRRSATPSPGHSAGTGDASHPAPTGVGDDGAGSGPSGVVPDSQPARPGVPDGPVIGEIDQDVRGVTPIEIDDDDDAGEADDDD